MVDPNKGAKLNFTAKSFVPRARPQGTQPPPENRAPPQNPMGNPTYPGYNMYEGGYVGEMGYGGPPNQGYYESEGTEIGIGYPKPQGNVNNIQDIQDIQDIPEEPIYGGPPPGPPGPPHAIYIPEEIKNPPEENLNPLEEEKVRVIESKKTKSSKQPQAPIDLEKQKERKEEKKKNREEKERLKQERLAEEKKRQDLEKQKKTEEEFKQSIILGHLEEVDEARDPISIVFIGHVDCGKSTICGQIMLLTGQVDIRTIQKYEKEAKEKNRENWWLAYVMDVIDDERAKGKTVEVGRAHFETLTKRFTIFDAPGHQNYVPNMIMGASMADYGCLVISAKKGEYEAGFEKGGQTREHVILAKSLGIQKLIVIINKMDEGTVKWSEERYLQIKTELSPFIKSVGFNLEKSVEWLPISGLLGINMIKDETKQADLEHKLPWYVGPPLLDLLDGLLVPSREKGGGVRIPVLDKMKDMGLDIFGKVQRGTLRLGDKVNIMPHNYEAEVFQICNSQDLSVPYAKCGENIKFKLKGVENEDILGRGVIVCSSGDLCPVFTTFQAELKLQQLHKHKPIISNGYQAILHLHTIAEECTIRQIVGIKDPVTKELKKSKYGKEGDHVVCNIEVRTPICAEKFSVVRELGRFTLRDEQKTVAIGIILLYKGKREKVEKGGQQQLARGEQGALLVTNSRKERERASAHTGVTIHKS